MATGPHLILFYDYVPDIVERRAPHREAHLAAIGAWVADGRVVMGGAIGDPPRAPPSSSPGSARTRSRPSPTPTPTC